MFVKQKLSFKNKSIFGLTFKNTIDDCFFKVAKMLFSGKINIDGTISIERVDSFGKSELWAYIYYLYYYNNSDVDMFISMKDDKNKASAILFYNVIKNANVQSENTPTITSLLLIQFINYVLETDKSDIVNPIFDYLRVLLDRKITTNMKGFELITGTGANSNKFEIVHGNAVKDANIKVSFKNANVK
jgi:hypothetical protein